MTFQELINKRYSLRHYSDRPIDRPTLLRLLEAGRIAPSAVNYQPWRFIPLLSNESRKQIQSCYPREWFLNAPLYILLCGDRNEAWIRSADQKSHLDVDVSIAAEHITLAAVEEGLGSCWVCNFDPQKCKELLELPDSYEPVVVLAIGYPENPSIIPPPVETRRKPLDAITIWR